MKHECPEIPFLYIYYCVLTPIFSSSTAIANDKKRLYGVQFHPEVDLTENGKQIFKNFLHNVCGLTGTFSMKSREEMCILEIQRCVGSNKVLVRYHSTCMFVLGTLVMFM